jgi:hypothetical protein
MKRLLALLILSLLLLGCEEKEKPKVSRVKRVVRISTFDTKYIELEDGAKYGMGENLYNRLVTELHATKNFVVIVNEPWGKATLSSIQANEPHDPSDRLHFEFAPLAAADFEAEVKELSFTHGSRGMKRFSGYSSQFTSPFNDGNFDNKNEFPPRNLDFVTGWFGTNFEAKGDALDSTILGVNAGESGEFNLAIAKINYRRDSYLATAKVETKLQLLAENEIKQRLLDASGKGFLFALGAGYRELSVEFGIAKRDALKQTFDKSVTKMTEEIQNQLFAIPFRTKIEKNGVEGIILNAGRREGIRVGDLFLHKAEGKISTYKIMETFHIGSRAELLSGSKDLREGDVLVLNETENPSLPSDQIPENRLATVPKPSIKKETRGIVIDPPEFYDPDGNIDKGLKAKGLLLPLLLWRWTQYDQEIKTDLKLKPRGDLEKIAAANWNLKLLRMPEAWRKASGKGIKIAVIDSGVDYNHENIAANLPRNYLGFDFMSHDLRPFDDNSHGTALAGIIAAQGVDGKNAGIAPDCTLLAYKIFDPYGQTSSAAIYAAVEKAIQDGAKILLLGWDTRRHSQAIEQALALAEKSDVLVVTSAGDQGENIREIAHFPARYNTLSNLLVSANLDESGKLSQEPSRWSNFGAVDLAAPGTKLLTLAPRNNTIQRSGTDLAAAHVAGVAALVWEKNPEASAAQIKKILLESARRDPTLAAQVEEGRVLDAAAALTIQ